ncbi:MULTISPECIES: Dam family site-specific DNA-(adenine-N6)-methyltransferase [unclassified Mesorhizobium]|uniref:DNA adenine methylase n=1 Tax=unclassified Mesorhizobium TaxID=325217 RepID=UPI00112D5B6F|nr:MULTISPECIES: Dam family site-specific DNA-(adenine-N6)-methyltransferase [unclassified Mesorhizobium]MCA0060124.1 Dam family site-specific DNA-(adenine-N6)-methyltransferase [Mesorhizobium sp. B261B1A]TPL10363.1 Dam family site-specific DNA-(adenine-N6)-methyltransferase [Mesorhizobium sp. B2-4-11]
MDADVGTPKIEPLLRWAGSKRLALSHLTRFCDHQGGTYFEPFCGSASLFFRLSPPRSVLSDLNSNLIAFYNDCCRDAANLWEIAASLDVNRESYYSIRNEYNASEPSLRRSALFYYLNRNCFNGIYRTNKKGQFNVPFSGSRTSKFPTLQHFERSCALVATAEFCFGDFQSVLESVKKDDFVFLDPPYATDTKRVFNEYHQNSFSVPDIKRVISVMKMLDDVGAKFVCTYDAAEEGSFSEIRRWIVSKFDVHRNIGGFQTSRRKATEIIMSNVIECKTSS